jgi:fructose-1,6-bisphosphatase
VPAVCSHPALQGTIASEEEDLPVAVEETFSGNYVVVFDPLDGSSNIDAGISTGSIFGIYDPNDECSLEVPLTTLAAACLSSSQLWKVVMPGTMTARKWLLAETYVEVQTQC